MWPNEKTFGWSYMMVHQFQDGGWPPSWISILGSNFGADQHFCTKFGAVMINRQPKGTHWLEMIFLETKMADSLHLGFRVWAIISASTTIFAPNLVQ